MSGFTVGINKTDILNIYKIALPQTGPSTNYSYLPNNTHFDNYFNLYMYGTRKATNFLQYGVDIGSYYQYDTLCARAIVVGDYATYPWTLAGTRLGVIFQYSNWIWNTATAATTAPGNENLYFYYTFNYNGAPNIGTIYACCDNIGYFYFNQVLHLFFKIIFS